MPVDLASLTSDLTALFSDLTGNTAAEGAAALAQAVYDNVTDAGGATVADGDYGDITVDSGGTLWTINAGVIDRDTIADELLPSGTAAASDEALRALGTGADDACAGNDARLSDTRTPTDGSVTAAKVAASLKPSGTAAAGDEALRALGTSSSTACAGNDSRLSDSRSPSGSASGDLSGSYPGPTVAKVAGVVPSAFGLARLADADAPAARSALGLAAVASSGSASDLSTGTLPAARLPALTGDVSSSAGSASVTVAKISGVTISGTPSAGQTLVATGASAAAWASLALVMAASAPNLYGWPLSTGDATPADTVAVAVSIV